MGSNPTPIRCGLLELFLRSNVSLRKSEMGEAMKEEISVVVVGGSIAGLSCALSLLHHHHHQQAGAAGDTCQAEGPPLRHVALRVVVLEKAKSLTAAGAGLGLDPPTCAALLQWGLPLLSHTLPLLYEENRVVRGNPKQGHAVARDEKYDHHAAHWSDVHRMLYEALPAGTVKWGHEVVAVEEAADGKHVKVHFRKGASSTIDKMQGNLVIAANGSMSEMRKRLLPHEKRRYCGYCAWRGVLDASTKEGMELRASLQQQYPDLGHCLYFDIAGKTHAVLYELTGNRLNWLWYVNQPEPNLKGSSVTARADEAAIKRMCEEAKRTWPAELASLMQVTPAPFINAIFDKEPMEQLVWGRIVFVGEAAHPTSPHGLRSTNMSIQDADVLGQSMSKWDWQVDEALKEFETLRLPLVSQQVLFSRQLGQVKQGLTSIRLPMSSLNSDGFHWDILLQRNMHRFEEDSNINGS